MGGADGSAYGIRTRDLRLERAVSLATRRMRHARPTGWGSRIRTSAYRSRVCRPTTRRIPTGLDSTKPGLILSSSPLPARSRPTPCRGREGRWPSLSPQPRRCSRCCHACRPRAPSPGRPYRWSAPRRSLACRSRPTRPRRRWPPGPPRARSGSVSPLITAPRHTTASNRSDSAILRATTGISKEPGTLATVISPSATPCPARADRAPSSSFEVTKLLNLATTSPIRSPSPLRSPPSSLVNCRPPRRRAGPPLSPAGGPSWPVWPPGSAGSRRWSTRRWGPARPAPARSSPARRPSWGCW